MTGISENGEQPILNVEGGLVAPGPLRRDLLPLYTRWINVHYTKKATASTSVHNRIVRVTANGSKVIAGSEKLVLQLNNQTAINHMGQAKAGGSPPGCRQRARRGSRS